jgi:hypothetical protein
MLFEATASRERIVLVLLLTCILQHFTLTTVFHGRHPTKWWLIIPSKQWWLVA